MATLVHPKILLQSLRSLSHVRPKTGTERKTPAAIETLSDAVKIYAGTTDRKISLSEIVERSTHVPIFKFAHQYPHDPMIRGAQKFSDFVESDINEALFEITKFASFKTDAATQEKLSILIANTLTILAAYDYFMKNPSHALYNVAQLNQLNSASPCKNKGVHIESGSVIDDMIAQTAKTIAVDLYNLTEASKKNDNLRSIIWFAWNNAASMQNPSTPEQYEDIANKNTYTPALRGALKEAFLYIYDPMPEKQKAAFFETIKNAEKSRYATIPGNFASYVSDVTATPKLRTPLCPDMC